LIQVTLDKDKVWIELTRRREHMQTKGNVLDQTTLKSTLFSLGDLKSGHQYDALISDVNYAYSQPLQITLSPFVKAAVSFDKIADPETMISEGSSFL
jgi:hypothetical protein